MKKRSLFLLLALLAASTACSRRCDNDVVCERYIHRYGVEVQPDDWAQRGQDGQVISTLSTGEMVTTSYAAGELHGDTSYTYPHSDTVQKVQSYDKGQLVREVDHNNFGQPRSEKTYHTPTSYTEKSFYDNGAPQAVEEYADGELKQGTYYTINNQLESRVENGKGTRFERDAFGTLEATYLMENGRTKLKKTFYPSGAPHSNIPYVNGKIEGEVKTFLPTGEPESVDIYTAGILNGTSIEFRNGEKFSEIPYVQGVKEGVEKHYRDGVTVVEEISWSGGLLHGPSTSYVGDTNTTQWYYKNKPVTKTNFDQLTRQNKL